jgi:ubiquinone/menaquinone biosynthesis C-methylase UbiE
MRNIKEHNKNAWNTLVESKNRWTQIASPDSIEAAKKGHPAIVLTPTKTVPQEWLGGLQGKRILALASGGGQQVPLLAAAGATVTVLDASPLQIEQDKKACEKYSLDAEYHVGFADNLKVFDPEQFDLVLNPCSSTFFPELEPVWAEVYRVLKKNGRFMTGFCNPVSFLFDPSPDRVYPPQLRFKMPYCDLQLTQAERDAYFGPDEPIETAHSLSAQLGGLCKVGFKMIDFYEDSWGDDKDQPLDSYLPLFIAAFFEK